MDDERESGNSVLSAQFDDDDIWFQVFVSNTNNYIVLDNHFYLIIVHCLHTVIYQVFLSNTNNLHKVVWFQAFISNANNYTAFYLIIVICLHTVTWFQVTYNNP